MLFFVCVFVFVVVFNSAPTVCLGPWPHYFVGGDLRFMRFMLLLKPNARAATGNKPRHRYKT